MRIANTLVLGFWWGGGSGEGAGREAPGGGRIAILTRLSAVGRRLCSGLTDVRAQEMQRGTRQLELGREGLLLAFRMFDRVPGISLTERIGFSSSAVRRHWRGLESDQREGGRASVT